MPLLAKIFLMGSELPVARMMLVSTAKAKRKNGSSAPKNTSSIFRKKFIPLEVPFTSRERTDFIYNKILTSNGIHKRYCSRSLKNLVVAANILENIRVVSLCVNHPDISSNRKRPLASFISC